MERRAEEGDSPVDVPKRDNGQNQITVGWIPRGKLGATNFQP